LNINNLLEAVSLVLLNTEVKQTEITKQLRFVLAHTAKKNNPQATISHLSSITDLTRKVVADLLEEDPPRKVQSKESMVLKECWNNSNHNNLLSIHGSNSFYSLTKNISFDYSATSVLNNLIKSGCIEHFDENNLLIKSESMIVKENDSESIRILCKNILKLTETVIHNMHNKDKMYQFSFKTNSIKPENVNNVHLAIFKHLKTVAMKEIQEIIESHEEDGINNFPEYMVSIFENYKL